MTKFTRFTIFTRFALTYENYDSYAKNDNYFGKKIIIFAYGNYTIYTKKFTKLIQKIVNFSKIVNFAKENYAVYAEILFATFACAFAKI